MKNFVKVLCFMLAAALTTGCADAKQLGTGTYQPYGLLNEDTRRDPKVVYEVPFGNIVLCVLFSETLIIPIYVIGYDLYEPVRLR